MKGITRSFHYMLKFYLHNLYQLLLVRQAFIKQHVFKVVQYIYSDFFTRQTSTYQNRITESENKSHLLRMSLIPFNTSTLSFQNGIFWNLPYTRNSIGTKLLSLKS